jgi:hypothetical protein
MEITYHEAGGDPIESLADRLAEDWPTLVAVSALTACVEEAYAFASDPGPNRAGRWRRIAAERRRDLG